MALPPVTHSNLNSPWSPSSSSGPEGYRLHQFTDPLSYGLLSLANILATVPESDTGYSDTLQPTFSSWLKNINALSALINRLSELAATAPQEHRAQLNRQIAALRTGFKKQQERCISFLQLTREYADRFLSDISEEIQQQSSFLDALERRLDMAKTLRKEAVHMRKSYDVETLDCIKKVRRTGVYNYSFFVKRR
jgi:hypothetical protein